MKTTIAKNRLIRLVVKYEKKVDDKCVNQTSHNSSGNATEHWQIWLANKQLSSFAKATERLMNLMFYSDSNEEHKEIRAMCVFKSVRKTATTKIYNSWIQFPLLSRGNLADLGSEFNITDCNTEGMDNSQPCVNISKSTGNNSSTKLKNIFERGGWPVTVLFCLFGVFMKVFMYYSPAFLCLFSPTEVTENGVRQIILEGASPVSFRSLMAIAFALLFSEEGLPYVACFVLVLYYVWSSYSSFTNKYQDLALSLFKHCKKSRRDNFTDMALNTDQEQENASNAAERHVSEDGVMKIPKELFHMACEELMPIREGVCILILKIIIIVCFVFLVFSLIMLMNVGATPVMKALLTFLTGSFPKIVDIYVDGSRQKILETMATDEKIPNILQEYMNRPTSCSTHAQELICVANVDEVMIPLVLNANEVNFELVNI
ncbi:hypothetical protein OS493_023381 [Desmophyllum pertusum]|uniref:Uncharacterized protein n=1 Tax=Desmophyllum pertusum TaxID=174260 RepID=A0A9X0A2Z4_9CNID|nr:hypothetical protein OS493_023381 [Desmophyllum pertusum]